MCRPLCESGVRVGESCNMLEFFALRGGVEGRSGVDGHMSIGGLASLEKILLALERRSREGEIGSDGRRIGFLEGVLWR